MNRIRFSTLALIALSGCAAAHRPPSITAEHPASPQAAEAPLPKASTALVTDDAAPSPALQGSEPHDHHHHHGGS